MNQTYRKNLIALKKVNPSLANKIEQLEIREKDFRIAETKNGQDYTLKMIEDDKERLVHSVYSPRIQAKKTINKLQLGYHNLIGVAGIGCGHYIRALLQEFSPESQVVVIENRLNILKEVMKNQDLTDILSETRNIKIFDGSDEKYITRMKNQLKRIDYVALSAGNVDFFKTPILKQIEKEKYIKFREKFFSTLQFISRTIGNDPGDSILGLKNAFSNLKYILKSSSLEEIKGFKNKPAVCVAAGPSLDKNIDVLKEYQDKVLIIAADTILEKLLNNGIKPNIVGALERTENVYTDFFKELIESNKLPEEISLIAEGIINPKIYNNFPGPKITVFRNTIPLENWFANTAENITAFNTGNSVANLNFSTAFALNCSPIILVGQDLAFAKDGKGHAKDTKYDEQGEKRYDLATVKGYNGEELETRKWWKIFKEWFEYQLAKLDVECIDATEGGAYIDGTTVMSLKKTMGKYCEESITDFDLEEVEVRKNKIEKRIYNFEQKISEKINNLNDIKERIDKILDDLEKAEKEIVKKDTVLDWAQEKFSKINTEIAEMSNMDGVFFFICQSIFIQLERYKVKLGDLKINTEDKFKKWCQYDIDKLNDIKSICGILIDVFNTGKENLEYVESARSEL